MKLLHCADVHLDSPLRGLARYEGAPADDIRGATRRAFENVVALAIDEDVECMVIAGDLYDGNRDARRLRTPLVLDDCLAGPNPSQLSIPGCFCAQRGSCTRRHMLRWRNTPESLPGTSTTSSPTTSTLRRRPSRATTTSGPDR